MNFYGRILNIRYQDHVKNDEFHNEIAAVVVPLETLLSTVKRRKLRWFGHVVRSNGLAKTVFQGTVQGGRPRKRWEDNIKEWTGLTFHEAMKSTKDRVAWRRLIYNC